MSPSLPPLSARKALIAALALGLLVAPLAAPAQQPAKVFRLGWLSQSLPTDAPAVREAFLRRLGEFGYAEGRNLVFVGRWAEGRAERLPALAADLVQAKVDVIVTVGAPTTLAAAKVTTTIPGVMVGVGSPVERGLVASLARPGGNVTGLSVDVGPELEGKRLELLREAIPGLSRVTLLVDPKAERASSMNALQAAAQALGVTLQRVEAGAAEDFDNAFSTIIHGRPDGLLLVGSPLYSFHRARIAEFAAKSRIPSMYALRGFVDAGGLMSYGPSLIDLFVRAATYVDKILKGAKPGNLPVEQPTKFELVINLKAAKALDLTIPQSALLRADEVIQ